MRYQEQGIGLRSLTIGTMLVLTSHAISANGAIGSVDTTTLIKDEIVTHDFIPMDPYKYRLNLPNIIVTDINPRSRGGNVVLEAWIKNDGSRDAPGFNVETQIVNHSNGQIDQFAVRWPALPAGASLRRELGVTTIVGSGDFFDAVVDADVSLTGRFNGDIWESNESDNHRREGFLRLGEPTGHIPGEGHLPPRKP